MTLRKTEEIFGLILVVNLKPDEKKKKMIFQSVTQAAQRKKSVYPLQESNLSVTDPDLEIRGGGGGGWGVESPNKKIRASVWSKNKGGRVPRTPPLDPPLPMTFWLLVLIL